MMQQISSSSLSVSPIPSGEAEPKTLWLGDVEPWMDDAYILSLFAHLPGEVVQVKVIRDKATGLPAGYGFIEFTNHPTAQRVLESHNGRPLPTGTGKTYRLNWASYGINERRPEHTGPEYSIFVGDLPPEVNDYMLQQKFASLYCSVRSAKVVTDPQTGLSRGYGFVRFSNEQEMQRAMAEMQGQYCGSRQMRINAATPKRSGQENMGFGMMMNPMTGGSPLTALSEPSDPTNTTVFIGGLDPNVTEDELRAAFEAFGQLVYVKIPFGKGCGFVQFTTRASAEAAFALHSTYIGNQRVRLSWGRSSNGGLVGGSAAGAAMGPKSPTSLSSAYPYPSGYGSYGAGGYGFSSAFSPAANNGSYATTASAPSSYHDSYAANQASYSTGAAHHHAPPLHHATAHHHHHHQATTGASPAAQHHLHHHHAATALSAATTPSMAIPTAAGASSNPQVHTPSSYMFYHSTSSSLAIPPSKSRAAVAAAAAATHYQLSPVDFTSPLDVEADNSSYALRTEPDSNIWSGADDTEMLLSLAASIHTLDFSAEADHDEASDADAAHGSASASASSSATATGGGNLGRFIPMFAS